LRKQRKVHQKGTKYQRSLWKLLLISVF
jgi:hypothetical protein